MTLVHRISNGFMCVLLQSSAAIVFGFHINIECSVLLEEQTDMHVWHVFVNKYVMEVFSHNCH